MNAGALRGMVLLLMLGVEAQSSPSPQSGDSEKNFPIVIPPIYEFGQVGAGTGPLSRPSGLAVGRDDLLYVADAGNHRIQMFSMNGRFRGSFGTRGRGACEFIFPRVLGLSPEGELFVADAAGRLQSFTADGKPLRAWDGLRSPRGLAISGESIYVTEGDTHQLRVLSRKDGSFKILAGPGAQPGRFISPAGVAVDEEGLLYVADAGNHRIQKMTPEGKPLAQWGSWGAQAGLLSYPTGLAYSAGKLFVADQGNHRVQVFDRNGALIRQWGAAASKPGEGNGRLHFPEGIALSSSGGLTVVSEPVENRIQVFINRDFAKFQRVNELPWWDSLHARFHAIRPAPPPPGCPPQVAGTLMAPDVHAVFFFDISSPALGPILTVGGFGRKLGELNGVAGVVMDPDRGRAYLSDPGNRRVVVLDLPRSKVRPELFSNTLRIVGAFAVDRLVDKPPAGYAPDMAVPGPLGRDGRGGIYLLDRANSVLLVCDSSLRFVRMVPVSPTIQDFAVESDGTVFTLDPVAGRVEAYDAAGKKTQSWGRGDPAFGDALQIPCGIAVDDRGGVYVSDAGDDSIRKFDRAGHAVKRWGATGRGPNQLSCPRSLMVYNRELLLVEDYGNHRAQLCSTEGDWIGGYVSGGLATPIAIR